MDTPLPQPSADTAEFWEGCRNHELKFQKCRNCGLVRWPPSILCPHCHATESEWRVSEGKGAIYSYVVYHLAFDPRFRDALPYVTAVVRLDEGPRILTRIIGCDPAQLQCEMPVEVVWWDVTDDIALPMFTPVKSSNESLPHSEMHGEGRRRTEL